MKYANIYLSIIVIALIQQACTYDNEIGEVPCPSEVTFQLNSKTDTRCGNNDGTLSISVNTPDNPDIQVVTFSIDGGAFQESGIFENLSAGSHSVVARFKDDCTFEESFAVDNADGLTISAEVAASACDGNNGIITITPENANGVVSYQLNNGIQTTSNTFDGLAVGEYEINARDEAGCETSVTATIESNVDFEDVQTIVSTNCAVSGCHAGNIAPDFRDANTIEARASRIAARTSAKSMPPPSSGRSLTDDEIALLSCWAESN